MRHSLCFVVAILVGSVTAAGCLPRTFVRKDPGPRDRGIRYYRPKPYLMVKPLVTQSSDDAPGELKPGFVSIETVMLPDFGEEYSIQIRSGLGVNETSVTLTDGWNLTAINAKLDSQFDENLSAAAEMVKALPGLSGGGSREAATLGGSMQIMALDVPMGLYEAVISRDAHGQKRLYGFRYVGFFPFAPCPIESCGVAPEACQSSVLYGLVYDKTYRAMVFKELNQLTVEQEHEMPTATARKPPTPGADVKTTGSPAGPSRPAEPGPQIGQPETGEGDAPPEPVPPPATPRRGSVTVQGTLRR